MNVVFDSDGEEYNDVIVRPKNYDKISGAVHRSMPEHEASTKMKVRKTFNKTASSSSYNRK
jgi:hypothetical protein